MAGNAWEWCYDGYNNDIYDGDDDDNIGEDVIDPTGDETAANRVIRGAVGILMMLKYAVHGANR